MFERSPRWLRDTLGTLIGIAVIVIAVRDTPRGDRDAGVNISFDRDDEQPSSEGSPGGSRENDAAVASERMSVEELLRDVAVQAARNDTDIEDIRAYLIQERGSINVELIEVVATPRLAWIARFDRIMRWCVLVALLFLIGPLKALRDHADDPNRRHLARQSVPYWVLTTAALLVIGATLVELATGVQSVQTTLAAVGSLSVASTDATLHYLITTSDADFIAFVNLVEAARDSLGSDPAHSAELLTYLWHAGSEIYDSGLLRSIVHLLDGAAWIIDLYGPLLGIAAVVVAVRMAWPIVRELVAWPSRATAGDDARGYFRFAWDQVKVLWREIRAFFWTLLAIVVVTGIAVVAIRLLALPTVAVILRIFFATDALARAGGSVPDAGAFVSVLSVVIALVVATLAMLAPAAVFVSQFYASVRERLWTGRRFRDFPEPWRNLRRGIFDVAAPTLLVLAGLLAVYGVLYALIDSPMARIVLPAPLFAPVMAVVLYAARIPQSGWRWLRSGVNPNNDVDDA